MKTEKTLLQQIAKNCEWHKTVNENYKAECENRIQKLTNLLPHGSGIDAGCEIDIPNSSQKKVVIIFSFHHMDENGYYDGWTDHKLIIKPEFSGYDMRITGVNKNQIKDYLYDTFSYYLDEIVEI